MSRMMPSLWVLDGGPRIPPSTTSRFIIEKGRRILGHPREFSSNWSGAVVLPLTEDDRFHSIGAAWTVPTAVPPPEAADGKRFNPGSYFVSTWIGIDGNDNDRVVQVGVFQTVKVADDENRTITTCAVPFCQWYPDCSLSIPDKSDPDRIPNLAVCPGDLVECKLIAKEDVAGVHFCNLTAHTKGYRTVTAPQGLKLIGASAEWVVERPSDPCTNQIQVLADYGSHIFFGAGARSFGNDGSSRDHTLANSILVNMRDTNGDTLSEGFAVSPDTTRTRYRNTGP